MKLLHKNLTPFFWGPKTTSRRGRQLELAICVRGVFRLRPGQPLAPIEDKLEQGFMSGDTWAESDPERAGPLTHSSDFAEWKPFTDVLLKGTAYPPKGSDVTCEVKFGVGAWSKTLRAIGPRTWTPGVLFGGAASDPQPFTHMPLTWENAYGGPGYAANPAGKGWTGQELPTVEDPKSPVGGVGARGVAPGSFLPVSPFWPARAPKLASGTYGSAWQASRAPYLAEDFDWTFWNAAPQDQQLPKYLRGDEPLLFENLHPQAHRWEARLPGLRIRALVESVEGALTDIALPLDTLLADTDQGKLYLTWRGHVPIRQLDCGDVKAVLIASEPLAETPRPREHYVALLRAFLDDPVGLKEAFPPGFLQAAEAIEAWEKAELHGGPKPDLKQVAAALPPGCPIPPWFLAAVQGDPDPLGIRAQLAPLQAGDPFGKAGVAPPAVKLDDLKQLGAAFEGKPRTAAGIADSLEAAGRGMPGEIGAKLRDAATQVRQALAQATAGKDPQTAAAIQAALARPPAPAAPPTAAASLAGVLPQLEAQVARVPELAPKLQPAIDAVRGMPTLDSIVAQCLAPLAAFQLPPAPAIPAVEQELAKKRAELDAEEQKLRAQGIDHPMLAMFAQGRRMIDAAPRPADVVPDLSPIPAALGKLKDDLLAQGVSLAALAPLVGFQGRVEALLAQLPARRAAPEKKDLAYQALEGADLTGRDLRGKSLARAQLAQARFGGAQLAGADLTEADLARADLTGVDLEGAVLRGAKLVEARLGRARLRGADLRQADLSQADLAGADLTGANLEGALLPEARAAGADLTRANLTSANLAGADLSRAKLLEARLEQATGEKVRLEGADLSQADLRFAALSQADLRGAKLAGADLSLAQLTKCRGDAVDLSEAKLDMAQLTGSRLVQAKLARARGSMTAFTGCDLTGADLRGASFEKADFGQAVLDGADLEQATLRLCMLRDTQARKARFVSADLGGSSATGKAAFLECQFQQLQGRAAVFAEADLSGSDFSHADLREAHLQGARGTGTSFFAARLEDASLRQTSFTRGRFVRANLCNADLVQCRLVDCQLTGANLYEAKLIEAELASCDLLEANLVRARFERAVGAPE